MMLKRLILILSISLLAAPALGADMWRVPGKIPLPQPAPERVSALPSGPIVFDGLPLVLTQAVNPDPFNTQRHAQAPVQSQSSSGQIIAVPTPVVDTNPGPLSWIWTIIGGVAAAAFGGNTINNFRKGGSLPREEIKNVAEQAALRVLDSGLPGQVVQSLANRVPILGGIVEQLRPVIREELRERLGADKEPAPERSASRQIDDQLLRSIETLIENRFKAMEQRLTQRFQGGANAGA